MQKNVLKKKSLVIKQNSLNEAKYSNISSEGLKFFAVYLTKIDQRDISTRIVRFTLAEFTHTIGLEQGQNIKYFQKIAGKLLSQVVYVPNSNGGFKAFPLFQTFELDKDKETGEWYIEIDAHDKVLELMFGFNNKYFKYEFGNIAGLTSNNQIRMYEILKQYEKLDKREISIEQLRFLLDIKDNEYIGSDGFENFKKKVLKPCQKALKEKTDICFDFKRGKTGRGGKWLSIIFKIHPNIAKKALIESTAKEIKNERVNKPYETTTTTQPKYNGFKEKGLNPYSQPKYNYSNKPCTHRKRPVPSFENKQWDFDALQKMWDKIGEDDEDDEDISNNDSNSQKDIDIDNLSDAEIMALVKDVSRVDRLSEDNSNKLFSRYMQIIEKTGDDEDEDDSNNDSNSNIYDIDIDNLSDDEIMDLDVLTINSLSEVNYRKFFSRYNRLKEKREQKEMLNHGC